MTKTDIQGPVPVCTVDDANYTSSYGENTNQTIKYRNNTTNEAITTPCPTVAVQDYEKYTHSAETIHPITAGAVPSTPCPVGQDRDLMTSVPHISSNVKVRGGRKGKGSEFMTVKNISDAFKEISAKNKILEQLSLKNGLGMSPKKGKIDFKNSDTDSPSKKTKFETTRHFWKQLEGDKSEDNFEQNTLMGKQTGSLGVRKII